MAVAPSPALMSRRACILPDVAQCCSMPLEQRKTMQLSQTLRVFSLQGYASYYTGHAKVDRLLFIAGASTDASVQMEALRLAHEEAKKVFLGCASSTQSSMFHASCCYQPQCGHGQQLTL